MAEGTVALLLTKAFTFLGGEALRYAISLVSEEASFLRQLHKKVEEITAEFEVMLGFLRSLDIGNQEGGGKVWANQVREVALEVEDIIDEYTYLLVSGDRRHFRDFLRKAIGRDPKPGSLPDVGQRLEDVESKLQRLSTMKERYGININTVGGEATSSSTEAERRKHTVAVESSHLVGEDDVFVGMEKSKADLVGWLTDDDQVKRRKLISVGEDDVFVGMEKSKADLVGWLTDDDHVKRRKLISVGEDDVFVGMEKSKADLVGWLTDDDQVKRRKLISVWGMGGLGKTTLVTHVFNSQEVKEHFHSRALVTVSKTYTLDDLLRRILREFTGNEKEAVSKIGSRKCTSLEETLHGFLQGKRYLLVLDDMWSTDAWQEVLNSALPVATDCGSRVILSTRVHDVAYLGIDHVIELQPLAKNEAWDLFCRKAFYSTGCPPNLERLAKAILDKCDGLPLAIVSLGSLLSLRDKEELEWQKVYDNLNWQPKNSTPQMERLRTILFLSFRDLPSHLKHCFLYCCAFPEDYFIPRKRLIRLWVAEGLVQSRGGLTMEDVAEENIKDLVKRAVLQVAERNYFGRVKYCRLHDMIRDVGLQISLEEKFCSEYEETQEILRSGVRRLSFHKCPQPQDITDRMISRLRSFLLFNESIFSTASLSIRTQLLSGFKLLRVLDLTGAPIDSVPQQVYCLFNLHYLSLKNTGIRELSESLAKLRNLQVLDLGNTYVKKLPRGITELKMLRHLIVFRYSFFGAIHFHACPFTGTKSPTGLWVLNDLQTLETIEASEGMVRHVGKLKFLKSLTITKVKAAQCDDLCVALSKMVQLHTLGISASEKDGEMLQLDTMSPPPQYLQKLFLGGRLKNDALPCWLGSLRNLRELTLHWTRLREDPLPVLHELMPSLAFLQLSWAYEGRELCFRAARGFPKLKCLSIANMPLGRIKIEEGGLGGLESLELGTCPELKMVPEGIEHLTALQNLTLWAMASELEERVRSDPDSRERVKHIRRIVYASWEDGQWVSRTS